MQNNIKSSNMQMTAYINAKHCEIFPCAVKPMLLHCKQIKETVKYPVK